MQNRLALALTVLCCGACTQPLPTRPNAATFVNMSLYAGREAGWIKDAVLLVEDGRVTAAGPATVVETPEEIGKVDLGGRYVIPGLVLTHGHVGMAKGLTTGPAVYTRENIEEQLALYARYGITTVYSLGGDGPIAAEVRQAETEKSPGRARLRFAGAVVEQTDPEQARQTVVENVKLGADLIKIRVDDQLGTVEKMPREAYQAAVDEGHSAGLRVAAHIFYLEDAKGLLEAGVDLLAHSVRDQFVDDDLVRGMEERAVCLSPTLTRELSTYVYAETPDFFEDPYFLKAADPAILEQLQTPESQTRFQESRSAAAYREALPVAMKNLKILADAGVGIAFGTDSGPPARFQGYFEQMEMELMAQAGLSPSQILFSATGGAAHCMGTSDVGVLEPGRWADLLVLTEDPFQDISNLRSLEAVYLGGEKLP